MERSGFFRGFETALEHIPDLIICDVMMLEKDGYEVCDILKNDMRSSHIPIILLTAKANADSKITGLRRGADVYLTKPFDKEELLVQLEMLMERQKRMVAYISQNLVGKTPVATNPAETEEFMLVEDLFIQKLRQIVDENYKDESFSLPQLCQKLGINRNKLFRKMKAIADISPSEFIRSYRLSKARLFLETTTMNVSEVAWEVGYKDLAIFQNHFRKPTVYCPAPLASKVFLGVSVFENFYRRLKT